MKLWWCPLAGEYSQTIDPKQEIRALIHKLYHIPNKKPRCVWQDPYVFAARGCFVYRYLGKGIPSPCMEQHYTLDPIPVDEISSIRKYHREVIRSPVTEPPYRQVPYQKV
jgi:hypothetical protein